MVLDHPGCNYAQLVERLFTNPGRNDQIDETPYWGSWWQEAQCQWGLQCNFMASQLRMGNGLVLLRFEEVLQKLEASLQEVLKEVKERKDNNSHVKQWKTKQAL